MQKPIIAITMGDPAGIGPEIILKAFHQELFSSEVLTIVIGDIAVMQHYATLLNLPTQFSKIDSFDTLTEQNTLSTTPSQSDTFNSIANTIPIYEPYPLTAEQWSVGTVSRACGDAAFSYITTAIELAKSETIQAVVTAPINKEALHLAGHKYPGHTEIFAEKCDTQNFTMLFRVEGISVVHVTTHCSLRTALDTSKTPKILSNIELLQSSLHSLGVANPRIAVAGVNPHAGEGGLFGDEEIKEVIPAIEEAQKRGFNVSGPYPPDTVFMQAFRGDYDGVVAMLHDHGFVALKSRDFENGVNITIGLPIIRTSVGHGTAFDIAGQGVASTKSLEQAVDAAIKMNSYKQQYNYKQ